MRMRQAATDTDATVSIQPIIFVDAPSRPLMEWRDEPADSAAESDDRADDRAGWPSGRPVFLPPVVVCGMDSAHVVRSGLAATGIVPRMIIAGTADHGATPIMGIAALILLASEPETVLLACPQGAWRSRDASIRDAVTGGHRLARNDWLVLFGGDGRTGTGRIRDRTLIRCGEPIEAVSGAHALAEFPNVRSFRSERIPDGFHEDAGLYMMSARRYLEELEAHEPDLLSASADALTGGTQTDGILMPDTAALAGTGTASIREAVMADTGSVAVVLLHGHA